MDIQIFQVDAFTDKVFGGNQAAVCLLNEWIPDEVLLKITKENNLAETAFFVALDDKFHIRWFTPDIEMDLCGHATLATAHVIFNHLRYKKDVIKFTSASGNLEVFKDGDLICLDFPSRMPLKADLPMAFLKGIGKAPLEVYKSRDYVLIYETEEDVANITPNQALIDTINIDPGGIIVTAKGNDVDFVSRFFTPQASIFEDPVTGSAHCSLIPFWAKKLGKNQLIAKQISQRGGTIYCQNNNSRVIISGKAITFMQGIISI